ncbi:glycosyltransferase [bacterium]|nr:glycosyltransferase [bacterium]
MRIIVIIATKNRFSFLIQSLESVHNQTLKPSEIIVTSDSDESLQDKEYELCKKYNAN